MGILRSLDGRRVRTGIRSSHKHVSRRHTISPELRTVSRGCTSSHDAEAGLDLGLAIQESKMTNPLGLLSSLALPAWSSLFASLMNSMPIFLLSHSSLLVLTFLT